MKAKQAAERINKEESHERRYILLGELYCQHVREQMLLRRNVGEVSRSMLISLHKETMVWLDTVVKIVGAPVVVNRTPFNRIFEHESGFKCRFFTFPKGRHRPVQIGDDYKYYA